MESPEEKRLWALACILDHLPGEDDSMNDNEGHEAALIERSDGSSTA
jgi:hypothetical protein